MALSFIMVLCLLIYRLAQVWLRSRLAQTQQTIPDQLHRPTARPTMRLSSFTTLKALNCSISKPLRLPVSSFYAFNRFIGSSYSSSGRSIRKSIFSQDETAKCGADVYLT